LASEVAVASKQVRCPGSGKKTGGWPGDLDTCPVCEKWVTVRQDEKLRAHKAPRATVQRWRERNQGRHNPRDPADTRAVGLRVDLEKQLMAEHKYDVTSFGNESHSMCNDPFTVPDAVFEDYFVPNVESYAWLVYYDMVEDGTMPQLENDYVQHALIDPILRSLFREYTGHQV